MPQSGTQWMAKIFGCQETISNRTAACPSQTVPIEGHPGTHKHLIDLRNKAE